MTNKHFTKPRKAHRGKTEIVTDPPVKITRAQDGSRGKDIKEELVEKPEESNWLNEEVLNDPSTLHGRQSCFGKWVERVAEPLKQIGAAEDASALPEMLTSEEVIVRDAAEKKLRKLEDKKGKEDTSNYRFDIIDIHQESERK